MAHRTARPARPQGRWRLAAGALALAAAGLAPVAARAALFEDGDARRAILDLRQKVEQNELASKSRVDALQEQVNQLQKSILDLNATIEQLRGDLARMRGADEQLQKDVAELQRKQKDIQQGVDDRLRKMEPQKVVLDGREFVADPEENAAVRRGGGHPATGRLPRRGERLQFLPAPLPEQRLQVSRAVLARQRALRQARLQGGDRGLPLAVSSAPQHPARAEALLSIANCQIELKDPKSAAPTIEELLKNYPTAEAAQAGRERLASLK
jgi:TolA-binding protein